MNVLQICSAICSFVSLLLLLISLGSDYWLVAGSAHSGLWNLCHLNVCTPFGMNVGAGDHAIRAFMLLGMIAGVVSFFGLCASFFKSQVGSVSLIKASADVSISAAICAMIAMSIFTGLSTSSSRFYGWSFGLGWASFPLFLITGVLAYLSRTLSPE